MTTPSTQDDPNAWATLIVGGIGVGILVVTIVGLSAMTGRFGAREFETKVVEQSSIELEAVVAEQREQLAGYRGIDESSGRVAIPIEQAMDLIVRERAPAPGGSR